MIIFLKNVKILELNYSANKHTEIFLSFRNYDNEKIYLGLRNQNEIENITLEILIDGEGERKDSVLFRGSIELFNTSYYLGSRSLIEIKAVTNSIQMDKVKKFRAYQNTNLSLQQILDDVTKEYRKLEFTYAKRLIDIKIQKPIIQYNETDWEFMIRLASHAGLAVYPTIGAGINIGLTRNESKIKQIDVLEHRWGTMRNIYGETLYKFSSNNTILLTDELELHIDENSQSMPIFAHKGKLELVGSEIRSDVEFITSHYNYEYIPNKNIAGKVIEGIVESIFGEEGIAKMTVDLTQGLNKIANTNLGFKAKKKIAHRDDKGRFNFPYSTPYSKTNTGLFCTPEKGDNVSVYFPSEEEIEEKVKNKREHKFSKLIERVIVEKSILKIKKNDVDKSKFIDRVVRLKKIYGK